MEKFNETGKTNNSDSPTVSDQEEEVSTDTNTADDRLTVSEKENPGSEKKLLFGIDNILKSQFLDTGSIGERRLSPNKCGNKLPKDELTMSYVCEQDDSSKVLPLQVRSTYPGASMNTSPTPRHISTVIPSAVYYNPFPWPWSDARRDKFGSKYINCTSVYCYFLLENFVKATSLQLLIKISSTIFVIT